MANKMIGSFWRKTFRWLIGILLVAVLVFSGVIAVLSLQPSLGAHGADLLRVVFGDKTVASLESGIYGTEDSIKQLVFHLGWAPHISAPDTALLISLNSTVTPLPSVPNATLTLIPNPSPTVQPTNTPWNPTTLIPIKGLLGESVWSIYLKNSSGKTAADLTSFQPDPIRPYAHAAVVAFNLNQTRLHFVLGTTEPYSPNALPRSGAIPNSDRAPGVLLAMFNGGFKAHQGQFGAMADGVVALPPQNGLGTLAIDRQGDVHIGVWGIDINPLTDWVAWRQNGPLIIQGGVITSKVLNPVPGDWGNSVAAPTPIWRSGIGLSADGKTLYYACGPSLTIEALANSLLAVGSVNAMQLDVNNYWVHFVSVHTNGQKLILAPLFPKQMKENIDRFLWNYERDYFYVTNMP